MREGEVKEVKDLLFQGRNKQAKKYKNKQYACSRENIALKSKKTSQNVLHLSRGTFFL